MTIKDSNGIYGATTSDPSKHPMGITKDGINPVPFTEGINPNGIIKGSTSGVAIATGNIGQRIEKHLIQTSAMNIVSNTITDMIFSDSSTYLDVPPGVWLVNAQFGMVSADSGTTTFFLACVSKTSTTIPSATLAIPTDGEMYLRRYFTPATGTTDIQTFDIGVSLMVTSAASTKLYLVHYVTETAFNTKTFGSIQAIRIA
jgi:hypothetical protein